MKTLLILLVLGLATAAGFIYSGIYDVGADTPHWPLTFELMETLRERSIAVHSEGIVVPELDDAALIAEGAEHYAPMCTGCHLAPGMDDTEMRMGLYPQPANLATHRHGHGESAASAARQFWIIKHGLKMTAMPAWGTTHDDEAIWGLVAFVRKLPEMSETEYAELTAHAGAHDHGGGHGHGHGSASAHESGGEHGGGHEATGGHEHGASGHAPDASEAAPQAADTAAPQTHDSHEGHQHEH